MGAGFAMKDGKVGVAVFYLCKHRARFLLNIVPSDSFARANSYRLRELSVHEFLDLVRKDKGKRSLNISGSDSTFLCFSW